MASPWYKAGSRILGSGGNVGFKNGMNGMNGFAWFSSGLGVMMVFEAFLCCEGVAFI